MDNFGPFTSIDNTSKQFQDKLKNILDSLQKHNKNWCDDESEENSVSLVELNSPTKRKLNTGKNSDCKRSNKNSLNSTPEYEKNPDKWIKYSLENDGTSLIYGSGLSSNEINRKAAFEFFQELRLRKSDENHTNSSHTDNSCPSKIIFKKPSIKHILNPVHSRVFRGQGNIIG
ncbi:hypothetical protein MXB_2292 [Myxobolus squamalis]|nr:hypothetical protein MXB_2292 [Myxobolus squamalis]